MATSVIVEPQYKEEGRTPKLQDDREVQEESDSVKGIEIVLERESIIDVARAIATEIAPYLPPKDLLWQLERLRWCAEEKLQLTTSQVKELIGVKPRGDRFVRGSFTFDKVGKIGKESAWRVENKSSYVLLNQESPSGALLDSGGVSMCDRSR
ncbi:MAG: hypothetical protein QNJ72_11130 [Pleurocapsa sp. MO_226.B13]|nr:hypothetical protein [Pleurocapsa sp. MO_226.B13]